MANALKASRDAQLRIVSGGRDNVLPVSAVRGGPQGRALPIVRTPVRHRPLLLTLKNNSGGKTTTVQIQEADLLTSDEQRDAQLKNPDSVRTKDEEIHTGPDGVDLTFADTDGAGSILAPSPIKPLSVAFIYVLDGTVFSASDDGVGAITGRNVTGTITYATGAWTLTFTQAPDAGTNILADHTHEPTSSALANVGAAVVLVPHGKLVITRTVDERFMSFVVDDGAGNAAGHDVQLDITDLTDGDFDQLVG